MAQQAGASCDAYASALVLYLLRRARLAVAEENAAIGGLAILTAERIIGGLEGRAA